MYVILISGMDMGGVEWVASDIEVKIKETHEDPSLIHQIGVVRNISVSFIHQISVVRNISVSLIHEISQSLSSKGKAQDCRPLAH